MKLSIGGTALHMQFMLRSTAEEHLGGHTRCGGDFQSEKRRFYVDYCSIKE